MGAVKGFLLNHFEKLALVAALAVMLLALSGIFMGGTVAKLRDGIHSQISIVQTNIQNAEVDPAYDPDQVDDYSENVLSAFKRQEEAVAELEMPWYPPGITVLPEIALELPIGVKYEETYPIEGTADKVSIEDELLGSVKLTADRKGFVLTRSTELDTPGNTLIHIYIGKEHYVHPLMVDVRMVYVPQPVLNVKGYAKPGRNFVIWETSPEDLARVTGFNVYRKNEKTGQFDMNNPINEELITPLGFVPEEGDDEPGAAEIIGAEEIEEEEAAKKEEAAEGEDAAAEEEEKADEEPEDEEPFQLPRPAAGPEGEGFFLPGPGAPGMSRGLGAGGNKGGMFVDRAVTPLQTYYYAVETVAAKTREELAKEVEDGTVKPEPYVKSVLSDTAAVTAEDVTKMYFRSLLGGVQQKDMAMAVIEVYRFEKVAWITASFNVKIGNRIGATKRVKKPIVDEETGEVEWMHKPVNFKTPYTLVDIIEIKDVKVHIAKTPDIDKETGQQRVDENGQPLFKENRIEMPFTTYKIKVKHDDGSEKILPLQKPRTEEPLRTVPRTGQPRRTVPRPDNRRGMDPMMMEEGMGMPPEMMEMMRRGNR